MSNGNSRTYMSQYSVHRKVTNLICIYISFGGLYATTRSCYWWWVVFIAAMDDASESLSTDEKKIFKGTGADKNLNRKKRWEHGIIGVKGAKCGEAIEAVNEKPVEI